MIPKETLEKIRKTIRRIEITTRKVVNESLAGQYHSMFKGKGMEFESVREYAAGDDIRSIDWNVTARSGRPFTKQFQEERELTAMLVVDASASMNFGTTEEFKHERAALVSSLLAFSAISNNDRVGLLIFTGNVEHTLPARKGRQHVLRLVRDVLFYQPHGTGSNIAEALKYVNQTQKKRAVVFIISDFEDSGWQREVQLLERRHDVVALQLQDPREQKMAGIGLVRLRDPETGERIVVDTGSRRWREEFEGLRNRRQKELEKFFTSNGIDHLTIRTDEPYDAALVRFFRQRTMKAR